MAEVNWVEVLRQTFDGMKVAGPKPILKRLALAAEELGLKDEPAAILQLAAADKTSPVREALHTQLSAWDYSLNQPWGRTPPNTNARRLEIYKLLELSENLQKLFDKHLPAKTDDVERELVITDHLATNWYTAEFLRDREFYWPKYRDYLKNKKGMTEEMLTGLNESANRVLESLAAPTTSNPTPRRGLVVGYVQSGKTTNFTAVIAKAIDAGYRLIIVLAGTIDLLRLQTQRRLDMELVGLENIGVNEDDPDREYENDPSFPSKFISYGALPRALHEFAPNIKRLTSSTGDFRSIDASFKALAFDELPPREKAYSPSALKKTNARLIVIKKVTPRLKKLLREIKNNREVRLDLPTLIIDDESDQASVNTVNPDKAMAKERSRTNGSIVHLLELLPRAQYVGYTATPFANVLVDPGDAADIYPRDFIISLPRPAGYMGVSDFHDLNRPDDATPNKDAFVRLFGSEDSKANESIKDALDAFVVSGALKLFRQSKKAPGDFRHHTMMIHETVRNVDQFDRQRAVLELWKSAGYGSTGKGPDRLRKALEDDFRLVSRSREPDLPFPRDYNELKPFVGETLKLIGDEEPVIVVNGDMTKGAKDPAFDTNDRVWKIIIGGAKLSRGFTVEGLTITYFRRRSKNQDTMMQMGRWFGYRGGYRDLVRLYLERGDESSYDLYDSFAAICRDEEAFRAQLTRYARPANGLPPIRPIQVPAVVFNSFPGIMPTAKNKMFNAQLVEAVLNDEWSYPTDVSMAGVDVRSNWKALEELVGDALAEATFGKGEYLMKQISRDEFVRFLATLKWNAGRRVLSAEQEFFRANSAAVKEWIVVLPQLQEQSGKLGKTAVSVHERSRKNEVFNVFSSPKHIKEITDEVADGRPLCGFGVAVIYPTIEKPKHTHKHPFVGVALYHPAVPASVAQAIFTVRNSSQMDEPVVKKSP